MQYEAGNQNWMISQAENKNIYIANSNGLLEYNGASWNLYPVPNNTIVRSVQVVKNKIFTGAYMEVGYWEKNLNGILEYTSLLPEFPKKVNDGEQFWHMAHVGETVVIQSFEGVYLYDLETGKVSSLEKPAGAVTTLLETGGRIFFQIAGEGLFTIEKGKAEVIIPEDQLVGMEVVEIFENGQNLNLINRTANFYSWDGEGLQQYNPELSAELEGNSIFSAVQLKDGSLLLGTVENGIYHTSQKGEILQHFNQENGLQNNTILNLFIDQEENAWAGLDNGISVLNLDSPYSLFQDNVGKIGTVYASLKVDDYLYLGTNQGLYFRRTGENKFSFIPGTNGQVWSLQHVKGVIFTGHNNGTFVVNQDQAQKISEHLGTWTVVGVPGDEDLFVQGHYNGFSFLRKRGNSFLEYAMADNFPHSSKNIVAREDGLIFIGNEHKGVFKIKMDTSFEKIKEVKNYPFREVIGISSSIFEFNDELYYSSKNDIFRYDSVSDKFVEGSALAEAFKGYKRTSGKIISFGDNIWAFEANGLLNVKLSNLKEGFSVDAIPIPKELRTIPQGYENISAIDENNYLLGLVDGYLIFDQDVKAVPGKYEISINKVLKSGLDEKIVPLALAEEASLQNNENNISFRFGIPEYKKFVIPFYSFRLKGFSNRWSAWNTTSAANFKNLSPGDYNFEVKARVGNEISLATYSFTVLRPWYFSNLAIIGYVLLFFLLIFIIHKTYQREHYKRIMEHDKTLKLKNLEAEQQIIRLQNEQLEREMAGKSKELAVSTMSLIKKNEFLTSIREKLRGAEGNSEVKSVIKTIDRDISEEDNWKFFKKAFSNADKDFFKKIKSRHPDLTSNDLKLCAYLRLNLTSKEIAPLLNISVKSVEIKRYRLRKKMDLPHETNLVDYVMEL